MKADIEKHAAGKSGFGPDIVIAAGVVTSWHIIPSSLALTIIPGLTVS